MFYKNFIKSINDCLSESYTVNTLRKLANISWKITKVITYILVFGGIIIAIYGATDDGAEVVLPLLLNMPRAGAEGGIEAFLLISFLYGFYSVLCLAIGILLKITFNAFADLIYSNEVSAKIKLLEYIEAHPEQPTPRQKAPAPAKQVVKEEKPNKKTTLNKSNVVDTDIHTPYWCDGCGHAGPYDGACPKCYSGVRRYNPNYKK